MQRSRMFLSMWLRPALRTATALVASVQLLTALAAPLAERAESDVAAVHVEQAGTSRHHAHGDFCAVCAASQLTALPPRDPPRLDDALATSSPLASNDSRPARPDARYTLARAPPV
jgi:hypothetical protein